jgi:Spy/CpxP family protein refolding chaperone
VSDGRGRIQGAHLSAGGVLLAVFIAGALVGAALAYFLDRDAPALAASEAAAPDVLARPGALYRQLGLTPVQRRQINRIVAEDRVKAARLLDEIRPRLRARYDSTAAAIRGVMTPEQQQRFDELRVAERARIVRRFGPGRLPPRGLRRPGAVAPPPAGAEASPSP